jgi:hypothetical protein
MDARYVFRVRFRLEPTVEVRVEPAEFETRMYRPADDPGSEHGSAPADEPRQDGWLFFRDNLWRGDLADETHFRDLAADALGVPVTSVTYVAFETDEEYLDALREAIRADLGEFKAESVSEVVNKYLGSSLEVE